MPSPDAQDDDAVMFGYVVANPFGLPKGARIFSWEEDEWFEGDPFGPSGLPLDFVEWLIEEGVIVPAKSSLGGSVAD